MSIHLGTSKKIFNMKQFHGHWEAYIEELNGEFADGGSRKSDAQRLAAIFTFLLQGFKKLMTISLTISCKLDYIITSQRKTH